MSHADFEPLLLYGGSFNPIHHGHLIVARAAAEQLGLARVVLLPSARPPHKDERSLADIADRLEMCRQAIAGDDLFEVSDWEARQPGPNYTIHTILHFMIGRPAGWRPHWLIGMDSLRELPTWHRISELLDLCTFVTAARPGFSRPGRTELSGASDEQYGRLIANVLNTPEIQIHSSDLRHRVRQFGSASLRYCTPEAVWRYIGERGLYA